MVVFGLGGITCVISILRLSALYAISKSSDVSWDNPLAAIWSSLEVNVGILCSCLPTLKGLVTRYFPSLFSNRSWGSRGGGSRHHTPGFELHGGAGQSHATCTANERDEESRPGGGRMSKLGRRFGGGGADIKEMVEEESDAGSSDTTGGHRNPSAQRSPPAIKVTRVVEQEEERDEELMSEESESVKELVPVSVRETVPHSRL